VTILLTSYIFLCLGDHWVKQIGESTLLKNQLGIIIIKKST
jgi:hypothetical protein